MPEGWNFSEEEETFMEDAKMTNVPPCGQPTQDLQEFHKDKATKTVKMQLDDKGKQDQATVSIEIGKEYSMKIHVRIPKGYKKTPMDLLIKTSLEMFAANLEFKIQAYDQSSDF